MSTTTVGIDRLGKDPVPDALGRQARQGRAEKAVPALFVNLPPCVVGIEPCSRAPLGAQAAMGYAVQLMEERPDRMGNSCARSPFRCRLCAPGGTGIERSTNINTRGERPPIAQAITM